MAQSNYNVHPRTLRGNGMRVKVRATHKQAIYMNDCLEAKRHGYRFGFGVRIQENVLGCRPPKPFVPLSSCPTLVAAPSSPSSSGQAGMVPGRGRRS